nr:hypothetical protein [Tanacetum cinerariifolium]
MLYDEFDKFPSNPGESIPSYYLRFAILVYDMNTIPMSMTPMQINMKFVNHLQPEWSRFVTSAKQARNLHSDLSAESLEETNDCEDLKLQTTTNFKAGHVDAYASDCDDEATANAIFMANLSPIGSLNDDTVAPRYDFNTLSEVPYYDTCYDSDVLNSNIQELGYIENIVSNNESYDELKGNIDVISYTNYILTIRNDEDNYVPPPVQKNDMMLSVIEQMKSQVEKCNKVNQEAKKCERIINQRA